VGVGYATAGGIADSVPVDVFVPGSPPTPFGLLHGILIGVGLLGAARMTTKARRGVDEPASPEDPLREAGP
jgi:Ni,Fe-hydrogenase III small subunit